ncbi:MAG: hypothetical protein ACI9U2_003761, partial [Bradymonadia bacterium]
VMPRADKPPTYWIAVASDRPARCEMETFVMRDGDVWTSEYAALRMALDL